ncbi:PASTA domain-containing protein [Ramlibacter ginsenosidimutans]|uniref:PASTA domain-containing protein n=1 Tax=Ramlibacter ginsenosidimutans TaxID=502333 RepID=A0A934TPB1_9BURK|nr:PASTA domain-containing protein [Ramlibacter ginsenosidimutans]MBK6005003.1 PASTA domain-containing protein [Ramlibacter ginsenosidimutans]
MSINVMQGALAAVLMQQRKVPRDKLAAGAALAAIMPGLPGLLVPVLMTQNGASASTGTGSSAGSLPAGNSGSARTTFVRVPPVQGMPVEFARQAIEDANLVAEVVPDRNHRSSTLDVVYTQTPEANSYVEEKSTVELLVQVAPSVPAVQGLVVDQAIQLLKQAGLEATRLNVDTGSQQPIDTIVTQNPKPGQHASDGKVTIVVQHPEEPT